MSHIHNDGSRINKQPNLSKIESQGPVSDSKFYGEAAFDYLPGSKKEVQKQQNIYEEDKNRSAQVNVSKNQSENPINLSQFKDQNPFDQSKIPQQSKVKEIIREMDRSKQSSVKNIDHQEDQQYNHYTPQEDPYAGKEKVKSVESEDVINNPISQNSVTEKIASGIVIRVKTLQRSKEAFIPEKVYIQIRNQTNLNAKEREASLLDTRKTKVVNRDNPVWDEDFYYNNNVILDDNITFILRAQNGKQIGRRQERNLSKLRINQGEFDEEAKQIFVQKLKLQLRRKDQEDGDIVGDLLIEISFYQRQDILGGVIMPNLSLKPGPDFVPKYNAVDKYQPNFTNKLGSKANCFNFFDGQTIPGFDTIEVFPPKFVKKNKHKKVIAAE